MDLSLKLGELIDDIPQFAIDLKSNISSLFLNSEFDEKLVYGCGYASSLAIGDKHLATIFEEECNARFSPDFIESIKSIVTFISLNNVWYTFRDSMSIAEMKMAPQKLKADIMANNAGLDKILFESLSLCVSTINGCNFCIKVHSDHLLEHDKTKEYVRNIGRIASVISSLSKVFFLK